MNRFWTDVIEPIALGIGPKSIVEIGSDEGAGTEKILHFCEKTGAQLHVVDPAPSYDIDTWTQRWGKRLAYHATTSLEALPTIERMDLVLIDGDHNWHTVYEELNVIHRMTAAKGQPFPVVFLHDVAWPYGRRDLYYDPDTVPADRRNEFASAGMIPGQSELVRGGGYNPHRFNAVAEGGPRNGVLTGVEDFIAEHGDEAYEFAIIPVLFGLGVLYRSADPHAGNMRKLTERLLLPDTSALLALAERERISALIKEQEGERRIEAYRDRITAAERLIGDNQTAMGQLAEHLRQTREQLVDTGARLRQTEEQLAAWQNSRIGRLASLLRRLNSRHPRIFAALRRMIDAGRKVRNLVAPRPNVGTGR